MKRIEMLERVDLVVIRRWSTADGPKEERIARLNDVPSATRKAVWQFTLKACNEEAE